MKTGSFNLKRDLKKSRCENTGGFNTKINRITYFVSIYILLLIEFHVRSRSISSVNVTQLKKKYAFRATVV